MNIFKRSRRREILDQDTLAKLSGAVSPITPSTTLAARMRQRIMEAVQPSATVVLRADEGEWQNRLPGISIKTLHLDKQADIQVSLWRLQAGARIPPHSHSKDEECLVLEGSVVHGDQLYSQGDFLLVRCGVRHHDFISPKGALLMIRGECIPNKLLLNLAMLMPH